MAIVATTNIGNGREAMLQRVVRDDAAGFLYPLTFPTQLFEIVGLSHWNYLKY